MNASQTSRQSGFTLIEISVVLVIIGLLVGGILVGVDLIKAAEVRATISQVQKYGSAVNAFRLKFNAVPGDMRSTDAAAFGLFALAGGTGQGDGNGLIEGGASGSATPEGETLAFWRHLSDANLVDGSFGLTGNSLIVNATGLVTANVTNVLQSLPATKLTPTQYFIVYANNSTNYFQILPVAQVQTTPGYTFGATGISPIVAYNIDNKLDDGMPNTGIVQAQAINSINGLPSYNSVSTSSTCLMTGASATDTADTYNRIPKSGGNDGSCSLQFRFD